VPEINGISLPFIPAGGVKELGNKTTITNRNGLESSFKDIFTEELNKIKFSAHAQTRMESRDIEMKPGDYSRLDNAFNLAKDKGGNDSLILLDEKAFVVSIPNKTVVTVVDKSNLSNTVFTNIDSAVIA
jgi:flagellar operon protein